MTRIQAGGVEASRDVVCFCCARFPSPLGRSAPSSSSAKDLDAKAAFVTIDTLHDLRAFAKKRQRQMLGRRSRIPVSCAGCLVFIRPLLARVGDATSAKWQLRFDLTSFFWTSNRVWPYLTVRVSSHRGTDQVCTRLVKPARLACMSWTRWAEAQTCKCRREYSVGLVHVCGCGIRKL
jgi:hypothetical protein